MIGIGFVSEDKNSNLSSLSPMVLDKQNLKRDP